MEPFEDRRVQHADTPTRPRRTSVSSRVVGLYEYFIRKARVTSPRYTRSFTDEKEAWHDVGERKLGSVGFVGDVEVGLPLREKSERGEILNIWINPFLRGGVSAGPVYLALLLFYSLLLFCIWHVSVDITFPL